MRKYLIFILLVLFILQCSCNNTTDIVDDQGGTKPPNKENKDIRDLVLIYDGGTHRREVWNKELFDSYVVYKDKSGEKNWLFDGFLFLEIKDGRGRGFASYYEDKAARKIEWEGLLNRYFLRSLVSLDETIQSYKDQSIPLSTKRKVVISIPEPIPNQTDWGALNGKSLDFSVRDDRVNACKWYIDEVIKRFKKANFENLQLVGFYWLAEEATNSRTIIQELRAYCEKNGCKLNWIPYFTANGNTKWKDIGFSKAYLQPNYFFNETVPLSRLDAACDRAYDLGMGLEIEFDDRALSKYTFAYRLENYLDVFERRKVFEKLDIAYYQGGSSFYKLKISDDTKDNDLYHRLAKIIVARQKKLQE